MLQILKSEKDFEHGRFKKSISLGAIRIRIARPSQNTPRFGFIIPKKVLPRAVDRNKIRRRMKNIITRNLNSIRPADILIFPQKTALSKTYAALEKDFVISLQRLSLWKS